MESVHAKARLTATSESESENEWQQVRLDTRVPFFFDHNEGYNDKRRGNIGLDTSLDLFRNKREAYVRAQRAQHKMGRHSTEVDLCTCHRTHMGRSVLRDMTKRIGITQTG